MTDTKQLIRLTKKITAAGTRLQSSYPFFGRLLLHLRLGFAECGTAYTNMKQIVFDPDFALRLSDRETEIILLHEVLHCALHHCTRGHSFLPMLYNIACDIVVNSLILETLKVPELKVDGEKMMHTVPDGREGRLFSAEQVYRMLLKASDKQLDRLYGTGCIDTHIPWSKLTDRVSDEAWNRYVGEALQKAGAAGNIPRGLQRQLQEIPCRPQIDWRRALQDFIRYNRSDYSYTVPDRRFQEDIIMPSFLENAFGETVEKLWFLIDTSGSVSNRALAGAFGEIKNSLTQFDRLSGELSFFDTEVSEPVSFETVGELEKLTPVGGGGTSFKAIFQKMTEFYGQNPPNAIIILTDGYAEFPEESAAGNVPVLWMIFDSPEEAPWGECIHIDGKSD